jgi:hypothetical protein
MAQLYSHLDFPETLQQKMRGQSIWEIKDRRYKVVFELDTTYANQSEVRTYMWGKDTGWHIVLNQPGLENRLVKLYHSKQPHERAEMRAEHFLAKRVEGEMQDLCYKAAEINK